MKLNFDTIKSLTVGALTFKEEDGALWFDHYTDETIEKFKKLNDFWYKGATCTTGVRLDFITDASEVIACVAGAGKYEIRVNGLMTVSSALKAGDQIKATLNGVENRVTLVLPSHSRGGIIGLDLVGATFVKRTEFAVKALFIGDSITQGWNARFDSGSYAYITSENLCADTIIQGVGGMVYHKDLFDENDFEPEIIVVAYGCNDFSQRESVDLLKEHATQFLSKLTARYPKAVKYGITPIWRQDDDVVKSMGTFTDCRNAVKDCLDAFSFNVVDGYTLVPHLPEYFADAVHPNDLGFAEMAKNLSRIIVK